MDATHRAIAWMLLASLAFASGSALVKWTAGHAGVATVIFGRSLVITLALLVWSRLRGSSLHAGDRRRPLSNIHPLNIKTSLTVLTVFKC